MYDTAKRGMVFAVATGGLLLAGAAHAAADTQNSIADLPGGLTATQLDPGIGNATTATHDAQRMSGAAANAHGSTPLGILGRALAARSAGTSGLLSNNSISIPATLSVNLCGNAVAVLGSATASSSCSSPEAGTAGAGLSRGGLLSSNTVQAPINVPVNACGDLVAIAGFADSESGSTCTAAGSGSLSAAGSAAGATVVSSVARILGDLLPTATTARASIAVPVNVCGNGVAAGGMTSAAATCAIGEQASAPTTTTGTTTGTGTGTGGTTTASAPATDTAQGNASASASAATTDGELKTSSTTLSLPEAAQNASTQRNVGGAQLQAPEAQLPTQAVAAASVSPGPCPTAAAAGATAATWGWTAVPAGPAVASTAMPASADAAVTKSSTALKVRRNTALATQDKPLLVHPVVVWPRPEPAALAVPAGGGAQYSAAQHALPLEPNGMTLAHTGAETIFPLGTAAATLTGGVGLRALGQHRRRNQR